MQVSVDQNTCIGCGLCTTICGEVFEFNDELKVSPKEGVDPSQYEDACRESAEQCPVSAILVE